MNCRCNNSNNVSVLCAECKQATGNRREAKPVDTKLYDKVHISGTPTGELQCNTKSKEHLRCNSNSVHGNLPKRSIGETFKCASILPALSKSKGDISGILPEKNDK